MTRRRASASRASRPNTLALALALMLMLMGCTDTQPSVPPPSTATDAPRGASIEPTPDDSVGDPLSAALLGQWRAAPVGLSRTFTAPYDATCRTAEPQIGDRELVLADARGDRRLMLVFADPAGGAAYVCRAMLDATPTAGDMEIIQVDRPAKPIGDTDIDALLFEPLNDEDGTRTVLVGQIGLRAADAILQFEDESFVFASEGGGWYAMWWPGTGAAVVAVAAVDLRNTVLGEVDL